MLFINPVLVLPVVLVQTSKRVSARPSPTSADEAVQCSSTAVFSEQEKLLGEDKIHINRKVKFETIEDMQWHALL